MRPTDKPRAASDSGTKYDAGTIAKISDGGLGPESPSALLDDTIYLLGSRDSKAASARAFTRITQPTAAVDIPSDARMPILTPDDQVLYIGEIRDSTTKKATARALFQFGGERDGDARRALPTPKCDSTPTADDKRLLPGPGALRMYPDTGEVLYSCIACPESSDGFAAKAIECGTGPWWDANGTDAIDGMSKVYGPGILATGYNKWLLLGDTYRPQFIELYDRVTHTVTEVVWPAGTAKNTNPSSQNIVAARGLPDGFRIVVRFSQPTSYQRFHIALDATSTLEGVYADIPADVSAGTIFNAETTMDSILLDSEGNLLQTVWLRYDSVKTADVVVKRPLVPDVSSKVYDETKSPWIRGLSSGSWVYGVPSGQLFTRP